MAETSCGMPQRMSFQEENVYEAEAHYENQAGRVNFGPAPTIPPRSNVVKKNSYKKLWRGVATGLGVTTIILLAASIALVVVVLQNTGKSVKEVQVAGPSTAPQHGTECMETEAKSCLELRQKGTKTSGVYRIKPLENEAPVETYCDMETDGGGWSLVASIHDSDIRKKCYSDDVWSSYVPGDQVGFTGNTNWENEMIFGNVHKCSEDDYKNAAFYSLNASNLMMWHVRAGYSFDLMKNRAALRYRTDDNFLQRYGGNLKNLFGEHFPLTVKEESQHIEIIDALVKTADVIKSKIPNWYEYTVGSGSQINDPKMYSSYGNQVQILYPGRYTSVEYGEEYRFIESHSIGKSITTTPYTFISVIRNDDRASQYFEIQLYSTRSSDSQYITTFENTTTSGNYKLQYQAVHFFDLNLQTVCRLYFVVSNTKDWESVEPSRFYCSWCYYRGSQRYTRYRIDDPGKVIFGYMLLTKKAGHNMTSEELNSVGEVILESIAKAPNVFRAASTNNTLVAPITFDKGTTRAVLSTIPTNFQAKVEPGFLQFRAYNYTGYPNAICPAVKVDTISPEYVCIGGISGDIGPHGTCGDFAGWAGKASEGTLTNQVSGSAHSHSDIASTILLFYR